MKNILKVDDSGINIFETYFFYSSLKLKSPFQELSEHKFNFYDGETSNFS